MPIKQNGDYLRKLILLIMMCVCVQLQDVYAVELSVCLLYTKAICMVAGLAIHSPAPVPTQSHPLVPAFLHSGFNRDSRLTVNCFSDGNILSGHQQDPSKCNRARTLAKTLAMRLFLGDRQGSKIWAGKGVRKKVMWNFLIFAFLWNLLFTSTSWAFKNPPNRLHSKSRS